MPFEIPHIEDYMLSWLPMRLDPIWTRLLRDLPRFLETLHLICMKVDAGGHLIQLPSALRDLK